MIRFLTVRWQHRYGMIETSYEQVRQMAHAYNNLMTAVNKNVNKLLWFFVVIVYVRYIDNRRRGGFLKFIF